MPATAREERRPSPVAFGPAGFTVAGLLEVLGWWFAAHRRPLEGRDERDPWRVLVTEVMSQQTQIERALAAAAVFCERFPTPAALAEATPADAIRAWAGLGYNRRVLALRRAAQRIVERHDGRVPGDVGALLDLQGVGPYTAHAVALRAFGQPVAALDVNVRRVLSRVLGEEDRRATQAVGDGLVALAPPDGGPARGVGWPIDALMDIGAAVCRPRPSCPACPLNPVCAYARRAEAPELDLGPTRSRTTQPSPFPSTRRWLRGRLLAELRGAVPDEWVRITGDRGSHGEHAVRETLLALAAEGFVELGPDGRARLAG